MSDPRQKSKTHLDASGRTSAVAIVTGAAVATLGLLATALLSFVAWVDEVELWWAVFPVYLGLLATVLISHRAGPGSPGGLWLYGRRPALGLLWLLLATPVILAAALLWYWTRLEF